MKTVGQEAGDDLGVCVLNLKIVSERIDYVIKVSCGFKGGSFMQQVTTLSSLVTISIVVNQL